MSKPSLSRQWRAYKQNPVAAGFSMVQSVRKDVLDGLSTEAQKALQSAYDDIRATFEADLARILTEAGTAFQSELQRILQYARGTDGRDGRDGESIIGPPGRDGKDGKDGLNAPTKEEIQTMLSAMIKSLPPPKIDFPKLDVATLARSLEALPYAQKLDYDTGLKNKPGTGRKESKRGGGGLGNVNHESKSVSSATTTITTNNQIAANGFAIWAYYQGQLIVRGTHYTVAGDAKTITLLFTPDDSTTIDLIYIQ